MSKTSEIETQISEGELKARIVEAERSHVVPSYLLKDGAIVRDAGELFGALARRRDPEKRTSKKDSISIIGEGYSPPPPPPNRSGEAFSSTQAEYDGTERGVFADYDCMGDVDAIHPQRLT